MAATAVAARPAAAPNCQADFEIYRARFAQLGPHAAVDFLLRNFVMAPPSGDRSHDDFPLTFALGGTFAALDEHVRTHLTDRLHPVVDDLASLVCSHDPDIAGASTFITDRVFHNGLPIRTLIAAALRFDAAGIPVRWNCIAEQIRRKPLALEQILEWCQHVLPNAPVDLCVRAFQVFAHTLVSGDAHQGSTVPFITGLHRILRDRLRHEPILREAWRETGLAADPAHAASYAEGAADWGVAYYCAMLVRRGRKLGDHTYDQTALYGLAQLVPHCTSIHIPQLLERIFSLLSPQAGHYRGRLRPSGHSISMGGVWRHCGNLLTRVIEQGLLPAALVTDLGARLKAALRTAEIGVCLFPTMVAYTRHYHGDPWLNAVGNLLQQFVDPATNRLIASRIFPAMLAKYIAQPGDALPTLEGFLAWKSLQFLDAAYCELPQAHFPAYTALRDAALRSPRHDPRVELYRRRLEGEPLLDWPGALPDGTTTPMSR